MPSAIGMKNYYKPNESVVDLGGCGGCAPPGSGQQGCMGGGGVQK
jgi:hypothetical protein